MDEKNLARVQDALLNGVSERNQKLVNALVEMGYDIEMLAAAAFDLCFARDDSGLNDILLERKSNANGRYRRAMINIGRNQNVAPNHIVSAVAEKGRIRGSLIGKIEIYEDHTIVGLPADVAEEVVADLKNLTICGVPTETVLLPDRPEARPDRRKTDFMRKGPYGKPAFPARRDFEAPKKGGKPKLSNEAKARILDAEHLDRFEIGARKSERNFEGKRRSERGGEGKAHRSDRAFHKNERGYSDRPNRNIDRRPNRKPNQKKHHG